MNRRSDLLGFLQTAGFLALLAGTGGVAVWSILPQTVTLPALLGIATVDWRGFWHTIRTSSRWSAGQIGGGWETVLFPASDPVLRRRLCNWARIPCCSATVPSSWRVS